ncbi:DNA methylase [Gordonia phage Spooky]|nr:DNA methylase [Gordonia phage Spooky]
MTESGLFPVTSESTTEWNDALLWLIGIDSGTVRAAIYDPPYATGTPVRGREDGAAGSVFGPLSFMSRTLREVARTLMPGGVALIFADWRRLPDLAYVCSTVGLRPATQVAWVRNRPGTGGLLRASWDPILVVARGVPDAIDRAAIRNVVQADYPSKRNHPYEKPVAVYHHILQRVVRPGDLVIDPFAGSGNSRVATESLDGVWRGCDIDPRWASVDRHGNTTTGAVY